MIFLLISIVIPDCCRGRLPECEIEGIFFCSTLSQNFGFTTNISTIHKLAELSELKTVGGNEE